MKDPKFCRKCGSKMILESKEFLRIEFSDAALGSSQLIYHCTYACEKILGPFGWIALGHDRRSYDSAHCEP